MQKPISEGNIDRKRLNEIKKLKDGSVLLSREELRDPNFAGALVLICVYNSNGAFGLVLNRPSHMPLSEVFDVDVVQKHERRTIYMGGPVQQEALQIIQITKTPVENTYAINDNIHLGGKWDALQEILSADQSTTRLFLGYSGWGEGQLEAEIGVGAWEVYNVSLYKLLTGPVEKLTGDIDSIRHYLQSLQQ